MVAGTEPLHFIYVPVMDMNLSFNFIDQILVFRLTVNQLMKMYVVVQGAL